MAQVLDPLPNDGSDILLCCYVNSTSQIQVARITNVQNWYFERVVFPGQRLVFQAPRLGQLEIHTGMMASAILSDTIPCDRLQITQTGQPANSEGQGEPTSHGPTDPIAPAKSTPAHPVEQLKSETTSEPASVSSVPQEHREPALASID